MYDARVRHQTYLEWMDTCGIAPGPWVEGDFTASRAYTLTHELLDAGGFSALICANDDTALGALRALRECGLRVPADVSVVGFDDHYMVPFYDPPLTTVRQDYPALSRFGIEDLIARIEDPDKPGEQKVLQPQLMVRASTQKIGKVSIRMMKRHACRFIIEWNNLVHFKIAGRYSVVKFPTHQTGKGMLQA